MAKKCFLWVEAILYISFLYLDIWGGDLPVSAGRWSSLLKYGGVWLCFFWSCRYQNGITLGLFGTVCADFFLLFTEWWLPGVACFIVVQLCYGFWLEGSRSSEGKTGTRRRRTGKERREQLRRTGKRQEEQLRRTALEAGLAVCAAALLLVLLAGIGVSVDVLLAVTAVYAMLLVQNTIRGIRFGRKSFAIGMCLFLLCDIQVGLYNAAVYLPQLAEGGTFLWLEQMASVGMWACYLPAKVLIALSGDLFSGLLEQKLSK